MKPNVSHRQVRLSLMVLSLLAWALVGCDRNKIKDGKMKYQLGYYKGAIDDFQDALLDKPNHPYLLLQLGKCHYMLDDTAAARSTFVRAMSLVQQHNVIPVPLGDTVPPLSPDHEAVPTQTENGWFDDIVTCEASVFLGFLSYYQEDYSGAILHFHSALNAYFSASTSENEEEDNIMSLDVSNSTILYMMGMSKYHTLTSLRAQKLYLPADSAAILGEAATIATADELYRDYEARVQHIHFLVGRCQDYHGHSEVQPSSGELASTVWIKEKAFDSVLSSTEDIRHRISADMTVQEYRQQVLVPLKETIRDMVLIDANLYFKAIQSENPYDARQFYGRGLIAYEEKKYEAALQMLDMAIILNNRHSLAYAFRGLARLKLGQPTAACEDYRKAVRYGYSDTLREFSNCR